MNVMERSFFDARSLKSVFATLRILYDSFLFLALRVFAAMMIKASELALFVLLPGSWHQQAGQNYLT
jgi:hypothetical protein